MNALSFYNRVISHARADLVWAGALRPDERTEHERWCRDTIREAQRRRRRLVACQSVIKCRTRRASRKKVAKQREKFTGIR